MWVRHALRVAMRGRLRRGPFCHALQLVEPLEGGGTILRVAVAAPHVGVFCRRIMRAALAASHDYGPPDCQGRIGRRQQVEYPGEHAKRHLSRAGACETTPWPPAADPRASPKRCARTLIVATLWRVAAVGLCSMSTKHPGASNRNRSAAHQRSAKESCTHGYGPQRGVSGM